MKLEPTQELAEAAQNLVRVNNYLKAEMQYLIEPLRDVGDSEQEADAIMFSIRAAIRAEISHIEAICYLLRRMVLALKKEELIKCFDDTDVLTLQDLKVDRNNRSKLVPYLSTTKAGLDFSFSSFARIFTDSYTLQKGDQGWESFLKALSIRNDITHPKGRRGLIISPEEFEHVKKTDTWFTSETNRLLKMAKEENGFLKNK